jgi:hypothetical protein
LVSVVVVYIKNWHLDLNKKGPRLTGAFILQD